MSDSHMNSGRWVILDADGKPIPNEVYYGPKAANRAVMILSAHEIKNGRVANYRVHPPIDLRPLEELDLPEWARQALENA